MQSRGGIPRKPKSSRSGNDLPRTLFLQEIHSCDNLVRARDKNMNQRMSDSVKSKADKDHAERSVEEFKRLSGQGNSVGWTFNREEIHQRK